MKMKILIALGVCVLMLFANPQGSLAEGSPLWGNLEPGPYPLGIRVIPAFDHSRTFFPKIDAEGSPLSGPPSRPMLIYLWYPAEQTNVPPLKFETYLRLASEDFPPATSPGFLGQTTIDPAIPITRALSKERMDALLQTLTEAVLNARPAPGRFPLLVFGQGLYYESPVTHFILCEYLASHGFVVATSPLLGTSSRLVKLNVRDLETQVRDMEFVISWIRTLENIDPERLGLIGFDLGGMSALILAMRNTDVDCFVGLDNGNIFEHNIKLLKQSPHYAPSRIAIPILHITGTKEEHKKMGLVEDFSVFDAAVHAELYLMRLRGLQHADFTSYAMIEERAPLLAYWGPSQDRDKANYETVCLYVREFFVGYLKDDQESLSHLRRLPAQASPTVLLTLEHRSGRSAPPTEDDFVNAVFQRGIKRAIDMARKSRTAYPGTALLDEAMLNHLGYKFLYFWGRPTEAVEIFKLNVEIHPLSANAFDSLGEAYAITGNKELATASYKKSLQLNPKNSNAARKLQELGTK